MENKQGTPSIECMLGWVKETQDVQSAWRAESWEDCAFRDGAQWTQSAIDELKKKEINALTVNRIFPVVNLILGSQSSNQKSIVAKARTQMDSEISQTFTEGIQFVLDQNGGRV